MRRKESFFRNPLVIDSEIRVSCFVVLCQTPLQVVEDETLQDLLQDPPAKTAISNSSPSATHTPKSNPELVKKRSQSPAVKDAPAKRRAVSVASTPMSTPCKSSTPEAKVTPIKSPKDRGFGGVTSRADHCWICSAPRLKDQKGSACSYCVAEARKELGHQRFHELHEQEELRSKIVAISLEKRGEVGSNKVNRDEVKLNRLIKRLENTVDRVEGLEVLVKDLATIVSQVCKT